MHQPTPHLQPPASRLQPAASVPPPAACSLQPPACSLQPAACLAARRVLFVLLLTVVWSGRGPAAAEPTAPAAAADKDVFLFIPHTHWEGAVFKTREEYLDMGLPNILRALAL